jgi:hypothetical protein
MQRKTLTCCCFLAALTVGTWAQSKPEQPTPALAPELAGKLLLIDGAYLASVRGRVRSGDETLKAAVAALEDDAKKAVAMKPPSVMDKTVTPASGDKHDYMSQAPYFWPNPDTPDGLPYVNRDGKRNPEIRKITDRTQIRELNAAVQTLAIAHYFTGDETYAERAALLLRTWFLDPKTRMKPNLEFGQGIPGRFTGRPYGIIEMQCVSDLVDSIGLLGGSKAWTDDDQRAMQAWSEQFLQWLLESAHGKAEAATLNNHGTHYDVQVVSLALFVGKNDVAKGVLEVARERRIAKHIEPDGSQPQELRRTKAWSYSVMNLRGLLQLARLGDHVGVDLWGYETADQRSLKKALDYLVPYATGAREWPLEQINGFRPEGGITLIRRVAQDHPDDKWTAVAAKLPALAPDALDHLTGARLIPNDLDSQ